MAVVVEHPDPVFAVFCLNSDFIAGRLVSHSIGDDLRRRLCRFGPGAAVGDGLGCFSIVLKVIFTADRAAARPYGVAVRVDAQWPVILDSTMGTPLVAPS
ncbi:hypothetical protein [Streptomyces sp. bgisy034]|uniref:hypothetical protein n=1 Tax=Streptomyces sp. bgisy034 TaxID=3413774 RepID=UPI003EB7F27E